MIAPSLHETVRTLWPLFAHAARHHRSDGKLLLAFAYIQSGLDCGSTDQDGGRGLFRMRPDMAETTARQLEVKTWDLSDARTALTFAAHALRTALERFGLPRLALAACVTSPEAVRAAGGQVPRDAAVQRRVRDIMAVWGWVVRHFDDLMTPQPAWAAPRATRTGTGTNADGGAAGARGRDACGTDRHEGDVRGTFTTAASSVTGSAFPTPVTLTERPWRIAQGIHDPRPMWVESWELPRLEQLAARLRLVYACDESSRTVYMDVPRQSGAAPGGRFIVPVPGCTAEANGAYAGATGLDILTPQGSPVLAAADGTILRTDVPGLVLMQLDRPFTLQGQSYPFVWYGRLSRLRWVVDTAVGPHVAQGDLIGWSGVDGRMPLLHFAVTRDITGAGVVPAQTLAGCLGWVS